VDTAEFDYDLPPERIAQRPAARRDASRLLVLERRTGAVADARFADLPRWLRAGDLLVLNDTRVLPARFYGRRASGGRVEGLFLAAEPNGAWRVLLKPSARLRAGERITLAGHPPVAVELLASCGEGRWRLRPLTGGDPAELLARIGHAPLPPYIRRSGPADPADAEDRARYQTVYAARDGAVAAPTAGLHFTDELLGAVRAAGVRVAYVTLHVGIGTFRPIAAETVEAHRMHAEYACVPAATVEGVRAARAARGRCLAVGTTTVRALETAATAGGPLDGWTDLYIRPGHRFGWVDGLVTNFHLPRSSLLVLVSAFAGLEPIRRAYRHAIEHGYRFYSYGDAMLIL
jgi:S-adenosylmethionine:tRNA ribosyltransferase-isomerase